MKIAGLVLIFAGVLALLKNIGVMVDWNIIWPIALIFVGMAVKHMGSCKMCGMRIGMGRCGKGSCGSSEEMECKGGKCEGGECKK